MLMLPTKIYCDIIIRRKCIKEKISTRGILGINVYVGMKWNALFTLATESSRTITASYYYKFFIIIEDDLDERDKLNDKFTIVIYTC